MRISIARLFPACAAFALMACAPYIRDISPSAGFSVTDVPKAKSVVLTSPRPEILAFEGSYESAFGNGDSLARVLSNGIALGVGDSMTILAPTPKIETYMNALQLDASQPFQPARDFLAALNARYLVHVKQVTISQRFEYNMNGSSQTICIVRLGVDIWNVASREKMTSFAAYGESSVFLFAFQTALKNAVNNAAEHTGTYLKTGNPGP